MAGLLLGVELLFALAPAPDFLDGAKPHFEWFFLRRYFEWFLGMWLAEKLAAGNPLSRRNAGWLALAGFAAGVAGPANQAAWAVHELAFAVGSCGLVGFLIAGPVRPVDSPVVRVFGWFGDFSYSLYLVHMPMMRMVFALETLLPTPLREAGSFAAAGVVCVVAVPTAAWLLYRFVEKPYMAGLPTSPRSIRIR